MKNLPDISYVRTRFDNIWAGEKKLDHADHAMFDKVLRFADACVQGLPNLEKSLDILADMTLELGFNGPHKIYNEAQDAITVIKKVLES